MRTQAAMFGMTCLGAAIAVPFFYEHRSPAVWLGGVVAFALLPFLAGVFWRRPTLAATYVAGVLVLLCPFVYLLTDPLDVKFEKARDAFFVLTSSTVIFVSTNWAATCARSGSWTRLVVATLGVLAGVAAVCAMLWLIMYLE
jgi:hypothetical protein